MIIKYKLSCPNCGEEFLGNTTLDLTQENDDEVIIDLDMFGGFEMICPECNHTFYIPDIRDGIEDCNYIEDEDF